MIRLVLLALSCYITKAQILCTNKATLLNTVYDVCAVDPVCMDSYYLTSSAEVWERPRFDHLLLTVINKVGTNVTIVCSDEEIFLEWYALVRFWSFCRRNEVYSLGHDGCVCVSGKNCNLEMNGSSGYNLVHVEVLLVLVFFGGAYFHGAILNVQRKFLPITKSKSTETTANPEKVVSAKRKLFSEEQT
jgi:hypothetical protein